METAAKASPTTLRDATDLEAAGVLMEVKADAVAAMERTAIESFMVKFGRGVGRKMTEIVMCVRVEAIGNESFEEQDVPLLA